MAAEALIVGRTMRDAAKKPFVILPMVLPYFHVKETHRHATVRVDFVCDARVPDSKCRIYAFRLFQLSQ